MRLWPWLLSLALAGCGDDIGIERLLPNTPPETTLQSGPPDSTATVYRVRVVWSGTDSDGAVDHFDVILVDHPPSQSHIGGDPADEDPTRVVVTVPSMDDPRWRGTAALESTFVTRADTLRRDPRPGPGETPDDVRRAFFERWHTVFVRAVDNRGLPDPTPDYVTFNATTLAPTIALDPPVLPGQVYETPPTASFTWDGEDLLDESITIEPVASRWVLIPSRIDLAFSPPHYGSFPDSLYTLPAGRWSTWQGWDRADGLGRHARVTNLVSEGSLPGAGYYIFAVQAMDEAGAVTPVFDWTTPGKNNVALVRVIRGMTPLLVLHEPILGTLVFTGHAKPVHIDVAAGQTLAFRWRGDASRYGAAIEAARYGWDIRDPTDDAQWTPWSAETRAAPPRVLTDGTHRFYVQVRDDGGQVSQAGLDLACHAVTRNRTVLWVDDTWFGTAFAEEDSEDTHWKRVFQRLAAELGFAFDVTLDIHDVQANRYEPPSLDKMFDHAVLVWSVRSDRYGSSGLRRLGQFFDPYPSRSWDSAHGYSPLFSYLGAGGSLWVSGFRPAKQLWPDERVRRGDVYPVNVTNWDDPIEPHVAIDSAGTISLLYRMGVEMFDMGAGLDSHRDRMQHFCRGLRRGDVAGVPELAVGTFWEQGWTGGRANVEIFNMPVGLAMQQPPLFPPVGRVAVAYTYVSGVPEDAGQGVVYPATADHQPVFVLAKSSEFEPHYTRAFCGFEPYLLEEGSHYALTRFVLVQAFQIVK